MQGYKRLIAWLVTPRQMNRMLLRGDAGGVGDVLVFLFVVMLGTLPGAVASVVMAWDRGVLTMAIQLAQVYMNFVLGPLVASLGLGLVLAVLSRVRKRSWSIDGIMTAASYLIVPVGLLSLLGAVWTQWFGVQRVLPNVAIGAFLAADPAWWEWALRALLAYGPSAFMGYLLLRQVLTEDDQGKDVSVLPAKAIRFGSLAVGLWLVLATASGAVYVAQHMDVLRPIRTGDVAPGFRLPRADGKGQVSLASLRGKPVLLEFWATWCGVCVSHMPELDRWAASHPKLRVIGIHQGDTAEEVQSFVQEKGYKHIEFLVDGRHRATRQYKVRSLPTFFLIGPDGRVLGARVGALPEGWLDEHLAAGGATSATSP